jgi:hypothetical protein
VPAPAQRSASSAGRVAAVLDDLEATRETYLAEIAQMTAELAVIETAITDIGKLGAIPAQALPSHEAANPVAILERTPMLGPNWQTNLAGIGTLLGAAAGIAHSVSIGQMPDGTQLSTLFAAITAGIGLLQAKDKNVTGGTVPATIEAKKRVGA